MSSPVEQSPKKHKRKTKKLLLIVDMHRPIVVKSKIDSVKRVMINYMYILSNNIHIELL